MPTLDEGDIILSIETPPSISLEQSKDLNLRIQKQLLNEVSFANRSITCNNAFANAIKEYIEFTEKTSSKSATSSQI